MGLKDLFKGKTAPEETPVEKQGVPSLAELGGTGLRAWSGEVYEEFLNNLRYPQAAKVYQEMADNDPVIGAVLYMSEQMIRNTSWSVEPASDSPLDKEIAEFVESCMDDMDMSWNDTITEILSYLEYGWSFHEIVYKRRKGIFAPKKSRSVHNDGKIGWRRLPIRSQHSFWKWILDEKNGDIKGFVQKPAPTYREVTIPMSKGLLFRTRVARNNPEGKSLLRNAYRPWYFKKNIEEIEGIGIERDLAGLPVIQPPEGIDVFGKDVKAKQYLAAAKDIVKAIRRDKNEGVVLPAGWKLTLMSTGGARQFDTNGIINRYDQRIAMTLLSDLVMMGADKVGSFALADVKKSLLASALEAQAKNIADVFNKHAIPQLVKINFTGFTGFPKMVPGEIETPDIREIGLFFRNVGFDIKSDIKLYNYLLQIIGGPQVDEEAFDKIISAGQTDNNTPADPKEIDPNFQTEPVEPKPGEENNNE